MVDRSRPVSPGKIRAWSWHLWVTLLTLQIRLGSTGDVVGNSATTL